MTDATLKASPLPLGIYLTDNGATYCREHLGYTAQMTGHDISGQPIVFVTPETFEAEGLPGECCRCETCGATYGAKPLGGIR